MNRDAGGGSTTPLIGGDTNEPARRASVVTNDQSTLTPSTPLSPQVTSLSKYNWDQTVFDAILPVRCRNVSGELHKAKFGSGGRGRCIRIGDEWFTPSEFEAKCGRGSSKDWKRSIRYGGRTLQCLIEESILQPHATSCTCAACCDDTNVSGPVRLFVPYKRRKKDGECSPQLRVTLGDPQLSPQIDPSGVVILTPTSSKTVNPNRDTIQVITADGTLVGTATPDTPVITLNAPQVKQPMPTSIFNFNEEKQWWQLEETVNNLIACCNQVKTLIEQIKKQSKISREAADKDKNCESFDELGDVESKRCANCNRDAYSECTGCHNVSYCSSFCQQKDWANHHSSCGAASVVLLQE